MISVSDVVESQVRRSPFLEEGLARGIVNLSALARLFLPEVRKAVHKQVTEAAVLMALRRMEEPIRGLPRNRRSGWKSFEMIVRSQLSEFTVANADLKPEKYRKLLALMNARRRDFFTVTQGVFETTVITSRDLGKKARYLLSGVKIVSHFENLSSITIRIGEETVAAPGAYYFILMQLAWEGINVIEVVSTYTEFTVILSDRDVDSAFSTLKKALPASEPLPKAPRRR